MMMLTLSSGEAKIGTVVLGQIPGRACRDGSPAEDQVKEEVMKVSANVPSLDEDVMSEPSYYRNG